MTLVQRFCRLHEEPQAVPRAPEAATASTPALRGDGMVLCAPPVVEAPWVRLFTPDSIAPFSPGLRPPWYRGGALLPTVMIAWYTEALATRLRVTHRLSPWALCPSARTPSGAYTCLTRQPMTYDNNILTNLNICIGLTAFLLLAHQEYRFFKHRFVMHHIAYIVV